jgi:bacterioferritin
VNYTTLDYYYVTFLVLTILTLLIKFNRNELNKLFTLKNTIMKGNEKLITVLNSLLADELTAINQYMVHSEMCENWGYGKLHAAIRKQAMDEMFHAEWLIERIIFLDGAPTVSVLNPMKIGKTVLEMIKNDNGDELKAVNAYNAAIKLGREVDDQGSVDLLTKILKMEEGHVDWAEKQRAQVDQMGLENYLESQIGDPKN